MIRTAKLPHCRTVDRCLRERVPRASALRRTLPVSDPTSWPSGTEEFPITGRKATGVAAQTRTRRGS
jgi:hypothetical protein